jgi:hypothetical protein
MVTNQIFVELHFFFPTFSFRDRRAALPPRTTLPPPRSLIGNAIIYERGEVILDNNDV